ncbi:hypothetical protein CDV31_013809 [Fusarium ambrosium]|uniref:Nephrocystin 3-like N-terminal domain-containing protein n=1 Tax=Fusarium ambrosium TaxID=131363 RepID=A0A428T108_9HYPO|nr:hypothetical protein CDV31_013809 [Fusarium ambrosium]
MTTRKKVSSPALYSIAWVAALPIERAAATALLHERHDEPEGFDQHANDANAYDWGEVGQHNVVIASLPAGVYGTTSAAITASHLLSSLPHIRIGLLVGIGGGIPRPGRDIRLGDIVVSQPDGQNGGVVQYDLGKAKINETWERKGSLNMPPPVLLNALGKLQAEHEIEDPKIMDLLQGLIRKYPRMKKHYVHQGEENDRLFSSDYEHYGGSTCDACDSSEEVERPERETTDPEIHYGTVASGNTLVKDAAVRDIILQRVGEECLCVEMEAAGLMNTFPCLVIRGICDYADSHKNNRWQRYAAATAAAFAVELLGFVRAKQLEETPSARELMKSIAKVDHKITHLKESIDSSHSKMVLNRLPTATGAAHDSSDSWLQATCLEDTRVDVLREIYEWASDPDSNSTTLFWLNGMAGTGKSTISRTVAQHLAKEGTFGGSFFFKKDQMYLAVLSQQLEGGPDSYTPQQKSQIVEEFRLIVGSVILLSTPLTMPVLAQLLHGDQDVSDFQETLENRLELLHSVLSVPPPSERLNSPVRALHLSFRDFLVDSERRDVNPFWVDEAKAQLVLAESCLRVMRTSLRENICELGSPDTRKTWVTQEIVNDCLPPHVQMQGSPNYLSFSRI